MSVNVAPLDHRHGNTYFIDKFLMLVCTLCNLHCLLCNYLSRFNYHLQFSHQATIGKGQSKQVVMTMQPHTTAHSIECGLIEMPYCTASLINNDIGER
jgi:hypothetical protein